MWRSNVICIKFCFRLSKMALETHRKLEEAFGDNAIGQMQTYEWVKHFKNRWMSVNDEERFGWCSTVTTTENVAKVWEAILEDQRRTNWSSRGDVLTVLKRSEPYAERDEDMKALTQYDFHECFRSWESRWNRCINAKGDYFEGDGGE